MLFRSLGKIEVLVGKKKEGWEKFKENIQDIYNYVLVKCEPLGVCRKGGWAYRSRLL